MKYPIEGFVHLVILYLVWGSSFLCIRLAIEGPNGFQPFTLAALRMILSGLILLSISGVRKYELKLPLRQLVHLTITGMLLWVGGNGLMILGVRHMNSGFAALCFGSMPLWAVVFEVLLGKRKMSAGLFLSAFVGFAGIAVLMLPAIDDSRHVHIPSLIALLIAPASWAFGALLQTDELKTLPAMVSAGYQQVFGGFGCLLFAIFWLFVETSGSIRPS